MRTLARLARLARLAGPLALLGLAACGPGAAYDNLSGGTKPDAVDSALDAPRPMSPISVSMVATTRPRFRWELFGTTAGAVVELSRTRAFDGDIKRYETDGRELVVPEDLDLGIWFWRLTAKSAGTYGTKQSPVWEVLVRGPAAHGSSDVPTGAVLDLDGDGNPDMLTVYDAAMDPAGTQYGPVVLPLRGGADKQLTPVDGASAPLDLPSANPAPIALAGGTDADGDGIADFAVGFYDPSAGSGIVLLGPGDASNLVGAAPYYMPGVYVTNVSVREAADSNGDGYGDFVVSDALTARVGLGAAKGPRSYTDVIETTLLDGAMPKGLPPMLLAAAFDANGDGFTDVAVGFTDVAIQGAPAIDAPAIAGASHHAALRGGAAGAAAAADSSSDVTGDSPILFAPGGTATLASIGPLPVRNVNASFAVPLSFTTGDFDGDGLSDMASAIALGKSRRVCVWYGRARGTPEAGPCLIDSGADLDLGTSIAAADVEGDGIDELLVTSRDAGGSIKVLRADGGIAVTATIPDVGPTVLTTIWPGRPGAARWAALSAGAHAIRVFEGTKELESIPRYADARGFGRALR